MAAQAPRASNILRAVAEMADAVIRIIDLCEARGWDLSSALVAKIAFNKTRPKMHGKKF